MGFEIGVCPPAGCSPPFGNCSRGNSDFEPPDCIWIPHKVWYDGCPIQSIFLMLLEAHGEHSNLLKTCWDLLQHWISRWWARNYSVNCYHSACSPWTYIWSRHV